MFYYKSVDFLGRMLDMNNGALKKNKRRILQHIAGIGRNMRDCVNKDAAF